MNILVTGASGFIGRYLSRRLKSQGHHVFGLSLNSPSDTTIEFKDYYQQDLSKSFSIDRHFDTVIHLAAYNITNIGSKGTGLYSAINVQGTRNLLQAVKADRFIYLSTAKVYKNEGLPLTENSPLAPQGAYEQSKLKAEEIGRGFLKDGSLVILRSVNVIGWGQAPKAVLPVFFQKAKADQPLDIISSAHALMQFVYVEDLVDALEAFISSKLSLSGIFNIAHQEPVSLEQLARKIIEVTNSGSVLNINRDAPETLFSPVICEKAYQQLGWKAKTGLIRILESYSKEYAQAA